MKKINILVIVLLICTNLFSQSNSAQEPEGCTFPENFKEPKGKKSASLKMMGASVKDLKEHVAVDNGCTKDDVIVIALTEEVASGVYSLCVNGVSMKYIRTGSVFSKSN